MWMEISAVLLFALILLCIRYKIMEAYYARVLRGNMTAMAHLRGERRLSDNERPAPGQGKML